MVIHAAIVDITSWWSRPDEVGFGSNCFRLAGESARNQLSVRHALPGSRPEHAQDHRNLPGMVNRVLHDSVEQRFVGIAASRNLFCQIFNRTIPNLLF